MDLWRMTDSGFMVTNAEQEDTPIFLELCKENNGGLFAELSKRTWG